MNFKRVTKNVLLFKLKTHFGIDFPYYLVEYAEGNFLVGCPESLPKVVEEKINERGGINYIFISHRDDAGIACEFRKKFNAKIILHKSEEKYLGNCKADISFETDTMITKNVEAITTPGHTNGNSCLLFNDYGYLFTGDQICVNKKGKPFVYLEKHSPKDGKITKQEVTFILSKLKKKNFTKLFSLFGIVTENAKARLMK